MRYATDLRNDRLDLITAAIDAGTGPGTLKLYTGAIPPTLGGAITSQTLLATLTFDEPAAPPAENGVLTFNALTPGTVVTNGTVTWGRIADGDGEFVADITIGLAGSGADAFVNINQLVEDGPVSVNVRTITHGNA